MKTVISHFILLTVLLSFMSCASVRVTADYDTQVDFSRYKTFAFYKTGIDKAPVSDLDKRRIMRDIEDELSQKSFSKSQHPDLLISFYADAVKKKDVDVYKNMWYPYPFPVYRRTTEYLEGNLFVDIIDRKSKKIIWRGTGSGMIHFNANPEKKEKRIKEFVHEILEKFPPKAQ